MKIRLGSADRCPSEVVWHRKFVPAFVEIPTRVQAAKRLDIVESEHGRGDVQPQFPLKRMINEAKWSRAESRTASYALVCPKGQLLSVTPASTAANAQRSDARAFDIVIQAVFEGREKEFGAGVFADVVTVGGQNGTHSILAYCEMQMHLVPRMREVEKGLWPIWEVFGPVDAIKLMAYAARVDLEHNGMDNSYNR